MIPREGVESSQLRKFETEPKYKVIPREGVESYEKIADYEKVDFAKVIPREGVERVLTTSGLYLALYCDPERGS